MGDNRECDVLSAPANFAQGTPRASRNHSQRSCAEHRTKGVDLRIGLDIARLSLRRLVDVIVVVTGDSDMVLAFKFARREGVRVYLDHMGQA